MAAVTYTGPTRNNSSVKQRASGIRPNVNSVASAPKLGDSLVGKERLLGDVTWPATRGVAISALQKSIRRSEDRVYQWLFELYAFNEIEEADGMITNLYNRLSVISVEDVSPYDLGIATYVTYWARLGRVGKYDWLPEESTIEDPFEPARVAAVVQLLLEAPKSRLGSHVWNCHGTDDGRSLLDGDGVKVDWVTYDDDTMIITPEVEEVMSLVASQTLDYLDPTDYELDDGRLATMLAMFDLRLSEYDDRAFAWAAEYKLRYCGKNATFKPNGKTLKVEKRLGKYVADVLIWVVLKRYLEPEPLEAMMLGYFKSSGDSRAYLQCAIVNVLLDSRYTPIKEISAEVDSLTEEWRDGKRLEELVSLSEPPLLEIHDLDQHSGYKGTEGKRRFAVEGTKVEPQDLRAYDEYLHETYTKIRLG